MLLILVYLVLEIYEYRRYLNLQEFGENRRPLICSLSAISEYQVQGEPNVISSCESNDCASDNLLENSSEIDEWVDSEGESDGLITGIDDTSDGKCL